MSLFLVPAGPTRLLQIVLQRRRNVGVYHQSHIGLVDAHSKSVGGRNRPQLTFDEAALDRLLLLRLQPGMEAISGEP